MPSEIFAASQVCGATPAAGAWPRRESVRRALVGTTRILRGPGGLAGIQFRL